MPHARRGSEAIPVNSMARATGNRSQTFSNGGTIGSSGSN